MVPQAMRADVLIVTVTKVEAEAVLDTFQAVGGQPAKPLALDRRIYHDLGSINHTTVLMARSEMGAGGIGAAQQTIEKGIADLSPSAVIMVGIAFGVDSRKQSIGDILVSQQLSLYELQRVGTQKTGKVKVIPRGDRPHASAWLLDRFKSADMYWNEPRPRVRFGLILSGEKLVDNIDFRKQLGELEPEAIGGEMEGAGLYASCQANKVDWILVKAIADWADGHKDRNRTARQRSAACNAARFVLQMLQQAPLNREVPSSAPESSEQATFRESMIHLSDAAKADCVTLHIQPDEPVGFVLGEATRHPLLFEAVFTSFSLIFHENVLLLSWDGSQAIIERVLSRQDAYPLNDAWISCLAEYRKTTLLPYRTKLRSHIFSSAEIRHALSAYRHLVSKTNDFLQLADPNDQSAGMLHRHLTALLDEAEFALASDAISTCIARLEAALSTIHKLILRYAPQGPAVATKPREDVQEVEITAQKDTGRTILLVDDDIRFLLPTKAILEMQGFSVTTASTPADALQALVEHEFDLVITDLVMPSDPPGVDGREVALAAKKSSQKTKVIVLTAYSGLTEVRQLFKAGVDDVMAKPIHLRELVTAALEWTGGTARGAST